MVVVAIGFGVLAVAGFIVGRWAWRYEQPGWWPPRGGAGRSSAARVMVWCSDTAALASGWQGQRACFELGGWKRIRLLGVLGDGSTVILACRRHSARLARHLHRLPPAWLTGEDRTIVLGVGDHQDDALAVLEHWREEGACLRVHIASGLSTVELSDESGWAVLRAPLVAA